MWHQAMLIYRLISRAWHKKPQAEKLLPKLIEAFDLQQTPYRIFPRWETARVIGCCSPLCFFYREYPNATIYVQRSREFGVIVCETGHLRGGLK